MPSSGIDATCQHHYNTTTTILLLQYYSIPVLLVTPTIDRSYAKLPKVNVSVSVWVGVVIRHAHTINYGVEFHLRDTRGPVLH